MPELTDDQIEAALIDGTRESELNSELGHATYRDLRRLGAEIATQQTGHAGQEALRFGRSRGTVWILPGIMGSRLAVDSDSRRNLIWFDPASLARGHVTRLKYDPPKDGVVACGVFWSVYGRLRLKLVCEGYRVRFLPFDWRRPTDELGEIAHATLAAEGDRDITLVAHSMGGLVARHIADRDRDSRQIRRIVTIGTPNWGSYSPVMVFRNAHASVSQIGRLDPFHSAEDIIRDVLRDLPGLVEMMPDPEKRPGENYFDYTTWPGTGTRPVAAVLDKALDTRRRLPAVDDRFHQIIGIGERTVISAGKTDGSFAFRYALDGDGTVPRDLAELDGVPKTFIEDSHGGMVSNTGVYATLLSLLGDVAPRTQAERLRYADGIGLESFGEPPVTEAELRNRIQSQSVRPAEVTDVAADFLGPARPAASAVARAPAAPGAPPRHRIGGYPAHVILKTIENWRAAEAQRKAGEAAASKDGSGPLAAESDVRKPIYAKRMAERLCQITRETRGQVAMSDTLVRIATLAEVDTGAATEALLNERVLGEAEEFLSVMYSKRAVIASKSVGCIVLRTTRRGFGSGFLVAPGILMTNHHVLPAAADAGFAAVQFDYELSYRYRQLAPETFALNPSAFFYANRSLDFALVAVEPMGLDKGHHIDDYGYLPLDERVGKIRAEAPVNIVQHPEAGLKQLVFRDSKIYALPSELDPENSYSGKSIDMAAHYTGDTKPGSSGSPVFSDTWDVVALHHSAVAEVNGEGHLRMLDGSFRHPDDITDGDQVKWIANEGIRISRIMRHLRELVKDGAFTVAQMEYLRRVFTVGDKSSRDGPFNRPLPPRLFSAEPGRASLPPDAPERTGPPIPVPPAPAATVSTVQPGAGGVSITVPLTIHLSLGGAGPMPVATIGNPAAPAPDTAFERRYEIADLADRQGYDPLFLGPDVPMPTLRPGATGRPAVRLDGQGIVLDYDHFSVIMNADRRMAHVSAGNYDPQAPFRPARDKEPWSFDPRIPELEQAGNDFYSNNDLDRGHLFRRVDGSWGYTEPAALRADHDTYFWTNISPQHRKFNQSRLQGIWGNLENSVIRQANATDTRFSVFNGPIFGDDDRTHRGLSVPNGFFKLIAFSENGTLRALAFRLGQDELLVNLPLERIEAEEFDVFQIPIPDLEDLVQLDFGPLAAADTIGAGDGMLESIGAFRGEIRITALSDIRL